MNKSAIENPQIALNGGAPVRTTPFASACHISSNEKELILDCLESGRWSTFLGASPKPDVRTAGTMSSEEANRFGPLDIRFLGGKYVRELENLFAQEFDQTYAVSSNSATSCLIMAMGAINVNPGDEIIVPCMSFHASATSVLFYNAVPVFAEVKTDTFCLDPQDVEAKITERTKAILVVHLGGNAADMDSIMAIAKKHNLKVIEDCAQSPGVTYKERKVGAIGDVGVFSLTETKNITCGEGGVLVTNDETIALKSRLIRNHGEGIVDDSFTDEELVNIIGMNFRLTELQAAVAIPQFKSLAERNEARKENTSYLLNKLKKYKELTPQRIEDGVDYVCFMLKWKYKPSVNMPSRDILVKALLAEGIPVMGGYPRMMYENPIFARKIAYGSQGCPFKDPWYKGDVKYGKGTCPKSEEVNQQFLWFFFINPPNTVSDMDQVVEAFNKILG